MIVSRLLAVDPGFAKRGKGCACAFFRDGRLAGVWFARPEQIATRAPVAWPVDPSLDLVLWECPQVDSRSRASVPAIVMLAAVGGELAGLYAGMTGAAVERVAPSAWKGSVPKPIAHGRLWRVLDDRERAVLGGDATARAIDAAKRKGALSRWGKPGAAYYAASFDAHNLLDAVELGCWKLGRRTATDTENEP